MSIRSDKMIPWYFVIFFVVIAIVDFTFVTIASKTYHGVVTEDAYKKGLEYNKTIELFDKQEQLGWKGKTLFNNNRLMFNLFDKNGQKISKANVKVFFNRNSDQKYNFDLEMKSNVDGSYYADIVFPLKGKWDLKVLAKWQNQTYQRSDQIQVQ